LVAMSFMSVLAESSVPVGLHQSNILRCNRSAPCIRFQGSRSVSNSIRIAALRTDAYSRIFWKSRRRFVHFRGERYCTLVQ
jgi:hypothetical protein